jgi:hypothetical protein
MDIVKASERLYVVQLGKTICKGALKMNHAYSNPKNSNMIVPIVN